jgi:hypothetical protein
MTSSHAARVIKDLEASRDVLVAALAPGLVEAAARADA